MPSLPAVSMHRTPDHSSPTPASDAQRKRTSYTSGRWRTDGPWHRCVYAVCLDIDRCKAASGDKGYKWSEENRKSSLKQISGKVPFLARDKSGSSSRNIVTPEQFRKKLVAWFRRIKSPEGCTYDTFWVRGSDNFEESVFGPLKYNTTFYDASEDPQLLPLLHDGTAATNSSISTSDAASEQAVGDNKSSDDEELSSLDSADDDMLTSGTSVNQDVAAPVSPTSGPSSLVAQQPSHHRESIDESLPGNPCKTADLARQISSNECPYKKRKIEYIPRRISSEQSGNGTFDGNGERRSELDVGKIKTTMNDIAQLIQGTVSIFMSDIKLSVGQASPYGPYDDSDLMPLFRTSFGDNFQAACEVLQSLEKLQVFDVLRSLMAAFAYNTILDEGLCWQQQPCHQIALSEQKDMTGALFRLINTVLSPEVTHIDHARQRARFMFAGELGDAMDKGQTNALRLHAEEVSRQATATMLPYLEQLIKIARLLSYKPVDGEPGLTKFTENIARLVEKCLRLKIHLCRSSSSHKFFWPDTSDIIDLDIMDCPYQQDCSQPSVVAYTLLPGIRITEHSRDVVVRPADVMARAAHLAVDVAPTALPMSTR